MWTPGSTTVVPASPSPAAVLAMFASTKRSKRAGAVEGVRAFSTVIVVVSGCQSGSVSDTVGVLVTGLGGPVPVASVTKRSSSRAKAICRPSGDQAGSESTLVPEVRGVSAPVPSASTKKMSPSRTNAIREPSGDHSGCVSNSGLFVSSSHGPLPSTFITMISVSAPRWLSNAIRAPSGDHAGWPSRSWVFVRLVGAPLPSAFVT